MKLLSSDRAIYHSVRDDFGDVLRDHITGAGAAVAALGPVYDPDPAQNTLAPFYRSSKEIGIDPLPGTLAPEWVLNKARSERSDRVSSWALAASGQDWIDVVGWTRAGLVLEIASRLGIPLREGTRAHVRWRLRGTVTGRFGVEPGGFNPLVIPKDQRARIVAGGPDRSVVTLDFRAMDLCSIISIFPSLSALYTDAADPHGRTAELVGVDRDVAKRELFVFAYGGHSPYEAEFRRAMPEVATCRGPDLARQVQERSATAFKAGLSRSLPLLLDDGVRPMFTVHDELVLDVLSERLGDAVAVSKALAEGASERIGSPYSVGMQTGRNYAEAKK